MQIAKLERRARPVYPPWSTLLPEFARIVWGPFLVCCLTHYGLHHPVVLSTILEWFTVWILQPVDSLTFGGRVSPGWCDPTALFGAVLFSVLHTFSYFVMNSFFWVLDTFKLLQRYKLPRKPHMIASSALVRQAVSEACVAQLIYSPPFLFLMLSNAFHFQSMFNSESGSRSPLRTHVGSTFVNGNDYILPSFATCYFHLFCGSISLEFLLYWFHRGFHHSSFLYRHFHKKHHRFIGTIAFASEYAHPVEVLISNTASGFLYWVWASAYTPPTVFAMCIVYRGWRANEEHSGYCFEGTILSRIGLLCPNMVKIHDWHHSHSDVHSNYGTLLMDYLFGTMDAYVAHYYPTKEALSRLPGKGSVNVTP